MIRLHCYTCPINYKKQYYSLCCCYCCIYRCCPSAIAADGKKPTAAQQRRAVHYVRWEIGRWDRSASVKVIAGG